MLPVWTFRSLAFQLPGCTDTMYIVPHPDDDRVRSRRYGIDTGVAWPVTKDQLVLREG
jgi:hypothetical protein